MMGHRIPTRAPDIVVVEERDETRLETVAGDRVCALNESALAIWELCDGRTTPDEMADAISELCSLPHDRASDDVHRTLAALADAGVIELRSRPPSAGRDRSDAWSRSST